MDSHPISYYTHMVPTDISHPHPYFLMTRRVKLNRMISCSCKLYLVEAAAFQVKLHGSLVMKWTGESGQEHWSLLAMVRDSHMQRVYHGEKEK